MNEETNHTHSHEHTHDHSHGHSHEHTHSHCSDSMGLDELNALLKFTLEHNEHHLSELHSMIHQYEHVDKMEVAHALEHAMEHYKAGNEYMKKALQNGKE